MTDVTELLSAVRETGQDATEALFPLVYDELRRIAAQKLAREKPGQTLEATALVHEVFLRLTASDATHHWDNRSHFFAAAAEAMRRILVERARRKSRRKHGGNLKKSDVEVDSIALSDPTEEVLLVDDVLARLEAENPTAAQLVKLRYFAGFTIPEVAGILDISPRKADQIWAYARAWLLTAIRQHAEN